MAEWDASPTLNEATGLPYSFQQVPRQTHVSLWASAASMVLPQSRYAALLVSLHGTALYEAYDPATGSPEDAEACATISDASSLSSTSFSRRSAQTRATRRTRQTRALRANRRLVARFDGISLALCHALRFEHAHEGVPTADGEVTIVVSPVGGDGREYVVDPWPSRDEASRSGTRDAASTAGSRTTRRCERRSAGLHG
jgi:hypothetical protein